MLISVILTAKEKILGSTFGKCLALSIFTSILSNIFIYLIAFFFMTSVYQRRRLYQLVMKGGQLIIIKAYNELSFSYDEEEYDEYDEWEDGDW